MKMRKLFLGILSLIMALLCCSCAVGDMLIDQLEQAVGAQTSEAQQESLQEPTQDPTESFFEQDESSAVEELHTPSAESPSIEPSLAESPSQEPSVSDPSTVEPSEEPDGVSPEFKAVMDSYEKFFDEYISFMRNYRDSDNKMETMTEYLKAMAAYTETMEKFTAMGKEHMTADEAFYYAEVQLRITKKLAEFVEENME